MAHYDRAPEVAAPAEQRLRAELDRVLGADWMRDGLRGLPIATLRDNLAAMTDAALKANARVLLIGQRLPPNYGAYATDFERSFADIARSRKIARVDFLLEGIATRRELFQADNLHPTAEAQPILLETVWKALEPLLK